MTKFKYIGEDNTFTLELVAFGIMGENEYMKYGDIVDVPEEYTQVIEALEVSGQYEKVPETNSKKEKK